MPSAAPPVLEVKMLCRYYGARGALVDFSDSLQRGETVFLVGPNGAGKSTLLSILGGTLAASSGECLLKGKSLHRRDAEQRTAIGYACERPMLYGELTITESLRLLSSCSRAAVPVEKLLEQFDLTEVCDRRLRECSQGMLRRAGLARAFLFRPDVLLLDEPFSHLDAAGQERLVALLKSARDAGVSIYIAAHETQPMKQLADRVITLQDGRRKRDVVSMEAAGGRE